jgi:hypothetical protein
MSLLRPREAEMSSVDYELARIERRLTELERLVVNELARGRHIPPSAFPAYHEASGGLPCCGAKKRALEALWAAYGPEPASVVVDDVRRYFAALHERGNDE